MFYVNAGSINTGAVTGGSQGIFITTGNLNVSSDLSTPNGSLYLYGNTLSANSSATLTANQVTFASTNGAPIDVLPRD